MSAVESWFAPTAAVAEPLPRQKTPRRRAARGRQPLGARPPLGLRARRRRSAASAFACRSSGWSCSPCSSSASSPSTSPSCARTSRSTTSTRRSCSCSRENANLASQLSSANAAPRIAALSRHAGLVPAPTPDAHRPGREQVRGARTRLVNQRLRLLFLLIVLVFGLLAARTAYLQTVRASSLAARATGESKSVTSVPAVRGTIFDRMGTPLAIAQAATDVVADPMQISDPVHTARVVSRVLGLRLRPLIPAALELEEPVLPRRSAGARGEGRPAPEDEPRGIHVPAGRAPHVPAGDGRGAGARRDGDRRAARWPRDAAELRPAGPGGQEPRRPRRDGPGRQHAAGDAGAKRQERLPHPRQSRSRRMPSRSSSRQLRSGRRRTRRRSSSIRGPARSSRWRRIRATTRTTTRRRSRTGLPSSMRSTTSSSRARSSRS